MAQRLRRGQPQPQIPLAVLVFGFVLLCPFVFLLVHNAPAAAPTPRGGPFELHRPSRPEAPAAPRPKGARSAADEAHVAWKHGSVAALAAEEIGAWELAAGARLTDHDDGPRAPAPPKHHSIAALAAEAAAARRREALEPPSTDEIPAFYDDGSGAPIVEGLDRCAAFRAATTDARRPAVAGLFNTGTNFLMKLLRSNCVLPRECEDRSHPGFDQGGKRARTSQLHRLRSRPFSTRFA